jgi:hypothetical protein
MATSPMKMVADEGLVPGRLDMGLLDLVRRRLHAGRRGLRKLGSANGQGPNARPDGAHDTRSAGPGRARADDRRACDDAPVTTDRPHRRGHGRRITAAALFAARAGQGLGAAMLSPAALAIIMTAFQGNQRAKALAAWGAVGGAGAAIGVLVGGLLTEFGDWRMIFYVNLPVAVALAVAAVKVIPRDAAKPRWRGLDGRGAVLGTGSLAALVYAITQAQSAGWGSTQTIGLVAAGVAGLALFAVSERHTATPLLRVIGLVSRGMFGVVGIIMRAAPIGAFGAMAFLVARYGPSGGDAGGFRRRGGARHRAPVARARAARLRQSRAPLLFER